MSVVGFDLGNLSSVIAVARNRGIDVICNEVSSRSTPSMISFGQRQRYLGEAAKTQEIGNFKNTVASLIRLVGRRYEEPEIQQIEARFINAKLCDVGGEVGVRVQYLEETREFTATQLLAMYLGKLRDITSVELKLPVTDVVLSCPVWFTDKQRRALLDAAHIAGLNPLRILNDTTAAALAYGITKLDLPEDKPKNVVLVDIGHAHYRASVVAFKKGQLSIKSTANDRHFGGRNFDEALVDHFAQVFLEKYKMDVKSNSKALLRLRVGCEKLKKVLSANPKAPLNVESIMDDRDVNAIMERSEFEELMKPVLDRIEPLLEQALADAGLTKDQVDSIELVGGSTRIPSIKQRISAFFNKELSTTLNQDEAVARGCALQCAIMSPNFRVREFSINDITNYRVLYRWAREEWDAFSEPQVEVFSKGNAIPITKKFSLQRKEPFEVECLYADGQDIPEGMSTFLGRYTFNAKPLPGQQMALVKLRANINVHGIVSMAGAQIIEEIVKEEVVPPKEGEGSEPKTVQRKVQRKHDVPMGASTASLSDKELLVLQEQENDMHSRDKQVADTEERKNALEEYVYEMRGKVEMQYSDYVTQQQKSDFIDQLNLAEEWLYGDGHDVMKQAYVEKLEALKKVGDAIVKRYNQHEQIPRAATRLQETIAKFRAIVVDSSDERYSHITEEERQKIEDRCVEELGRIKREMAEFAKLSKTDMPALNSEETLKREQELVFFSTAILNRPKPAPTPPAPTPTPASAAPDVEMKDASTNAAADADVDMKETADAKSALDELD